MTCTYAKSGLMGKSASPTAARTRRANSRQTNPGLASRFNSLRSECIVPRTAQAALYLK